MTEPIYDIRQFFRRAFRAGLIDGPSFRNLDGRDGCWTQEVQFQLAVGDPYLWSDIEAVCLDSETVAAEGTACCHVDAGFRDEVAVLEIEANGATGNIEITFTPTAGDTCPAAEDPSFEASTLAMSDGDILTIDSVARQIRFFDASEDEERPGWDMLTFQGVFEWFDVHRDTNACVCVEVPAGSASVDVSVRTRTREL